MYIIHFENRPGLMPVGKRLVVRMALSKLFCGKTIQV